MNTLSPRVLKSRYSDWSKRSDPFLGHYYQNWIPIKYEKSFVPGHTKSNKGIFWKSSIYSSLKSSWYPPHSIFARHAIIWLFHLHMAVKSTTSFLSFVLPKYCCHLVILCQKKLLPLCEKLRTLGFWVSTSRLTAAIQALKIILCEYVLGMLLSILISGAITHLH